MATTYGTSDFRKGLRVEFDGDPYLVVECEFRKPGKGSAIYTLKVKNLLNGRVIEKTFRSGDSILGADCHDQKMQYIFNDTKDWHFMDLESYEQYAVSKEQLGDLWKFLVEEIMCDVTFYNGNPITVTPPNHVELEVEFRLLWQMADTRALGGPGLTEKVVVEAGHDPQECAFTGTVGADHANLRSVKEGEPYALEDLPFGRDDLAEVLHHIDELLVAHWD